MLLYHRDILVQIERKPVGTIVNETTDCFLRERADNPEKLKRFCGV